jgi:hypothetical protein
MEKRTRYQEKVIRNFYENREAISVQRLQELVTELFLSTGKKRQQNWKLIATHLEHLGAPAAQIESLVAEDKPESVLSFVEKIANKKG